MVSFWFSFKIYSSFVNFKFEYSHQDLHPEGNIDTGDIPSSDRGNSESDGFDTPILQNVSSQFDDMRMLEAMHANESGTSNCSDGDITDVGLPARVLVYTSLLMTMSRFYFL